MGALGDAAAACGEGMGQTPHPEKRELWRNGRSLS